MNTLYEEIGGAKGVRELVDHFYDSMDTEAYIDIRSLHARSLKSSREKLFAFLSGWMGGPALYHERYGNPMLRARHLPFSIGNRERDQWMQCMEDAMVKMGLEPMLRLNLRTAFLQAANFMRNRPGENSVEYVAQKEDHSKPQ